MVSQNVGKLFRDTRSAGRSFASQDTKSVDNKSSFQDVCWTKQKTRVARLHELRQSLTIPTHVPAETAFVRDETQRIETPMERHDTPSASIFIPHLAHRDGGIQHG